MATSAGNGNQGTSTRPYLIRALHDWCTDNGFTPYIAVFVDASVQVPTEYVKNGEIVLNVGFEATSALKLGNEFIEFKARFGGTSRDILVPVSHVIAIYARENGQGMAFPVPAEAPAGAPARSPGELTGLRLASMDAVPVVDEEPPEPPGLRLASVEEALAEGAPTVPAEEGEEPPEPPNRPSLKRVK